MMEFFKNLFSQEFMPHGHCLFWKTELLRLYVIGDGLTAIAYFSIPIAIVYFIYKRKDLVYKWVFIIFCIFIILCGITHLMFICTLWNPMYRLEIVIKLLTAVVSVATAIILWPIIPKILALPSPTQLREGNEKLIQEVSEHKHTEKQLKDLHSHLEMKVEERTISLTNVNKELEHEIVERKKAEFQISGQSTTLNAINKIFMEALTCKTEEEVALICLRLAQELTDSQYGFYGEINKDGFFDTIALSDPGWDTCRIPESNAVKQIINMKIHGIYGLVLKGGKSQIVNDPGSHSDRIGIPEGHPPLDSFLGIPLKRGGKTIGMIALANKEPGYDQDDQQAIEALTVAFVEVLMNKRAEIMLRKAYDELEDKVEERTTEVEEKANKLEKSEKALIYLLEDVNGIRDDLEKANLKLKELDQLKSMFIASMSHELRTPLNSVIGFTGIILQGMVGELNPKQKDHLGRVNKSAKHLLLLINDIIDLSKVEAGKVDVFVEDIALDEVINEAVDSVRLQANEKGLALDASVQQGVRMNTDRKRLYQCVLNYLSNAVKFTEKGTVSIAAHENNGEVEIVVSDTGIGISEEDQHRLFTPFTRIDSHLRAKVLGTGLGLYLTRKLASDILKGSVEVQSQPGQGSAFTLRLPKEIKQG